MTACEEVHRKYDALAHAEVQAGELPAWMRIQGRVAWYAVQGPYDHLGDAWAEFMQKALASDIGPVSGPPGDVYVCDPLDHLAEAEERLTTILWVPLKD